MTDQITLVGVGGYGYHGVLESERAEGQQFFVDLVLNVDTAPAGASDDLTLTVDYSQVAAEVAGVIEGEPVNLIETLAARIAAQVLTHELVRSVEVTVHKPSAPIGVPFTDVQVRITRDRDDAALAALIPAAAAAPLDAEGAQPDASAAAVPEDAVAEDAVAAGVVASPAEEPAPDLSARPAGMVPVVLALGGNVGNVTATLRSAVKDLSSTAGFVIDAVGPLARTAAVTAPGSEPQDDYHNTVVVARTELSPMEVLDLAHRVENQYGRQRLTYWGERTLDIDVIAYGQIRSTAADLTLPHPRAHERAFVLQPWALADPTATLEVAPGEVRSVAELGINAPDASGIRWINLDWYTAGEGATVEPTSVAPSPVESNPVESSPVQASSVESSPVEPSLEPSPAPEANPEPEASPVPEANPEPGVSPVREVSPAAPSPVSTIEPAQEPEPPAAAPAPWEKPVEKTMPPSFTPKWAPLRSDDS